MEAHHDRQRQQGQAVRAASFETTLMLWSPIFGLIVGVLIMTFGFRKREPKPVVFDNIDGALKQDWTRTGNIDFHIPSLESSLPQQMFLRVEEKQIIENAMGQEVTQLRWRLATLEEAKEVVICWNASKSAERPWREHRAHGAGRLT
jgi:hypothetical protein